MQGPESRFRLHNPVSVQDAFRQPIPNCPVGATGASYQGYRCKPMFILERRMIPNEAHRSGRRGGRRAPPFRPAPPQRPTNPSSAVRPSPGGYSEQQLEPNRWRVTFSGNSLTDRRTVENYLLYRSAELTLSQGFDWFSTIRPADRPQRPALLRPGLRPRLGLRLWRLLGPLLAVLWRPPRLLGRLGPVGRLGLRRLLGRRSLGHPPGHPLRGQRRDLYGSRPQARGRPALLRRPRRGRTVEAHDRAAQVRVLAAARGSA